MMNDPEIIFADEPTASLDHANGHLVVDLLSAYRERGTVVVVTHDREMVDNMRRRVVELYEGRVVRDEVSGGYTEESTSEFGLRMRAEMGVGAQGEPRTNGHDHEALR